MRRFACPLLFLLALGSRAGAEEDDGLVPWQPGALAQMQEQREPQGAEREAARGDAESYHRSVSQLWGELSRTLRTATVEETVIDPDGLGGRRLAVLAIPTSVNVAAEKASCDLRDGSAGPRLLASLSGLSLAKRRVLLSAAADREHMMFFVGSLRKLKGSRYLDVEDFFDAGAVPRWTLPETYSVLNSSVPLRWIGEERRADSERTAAVLRDKRWPYVPRKDVLADPGRRLDRPLTTLGFPDLYHCSAEGRSPACAFQETWFGIGVPFIEVLLSKLPRSEFEGVFRGRRFGAGFAVRGRVRRAANGAFYLEADSMEPVAAATSIEGLLNPRYFDSKEYKAKLSGAHEGAVSARAEAARRWSAPEAEVEELVLSTSAYLGRLVKTLGLAYDLHRGPDGLVGGLGYRAWSMPDVAVRLEDVPAPKRSQAGAWPERSRRVLLVRGTVREKEGKPYIDADDYIDGGPAPDGISSIHEVLDYSPRKMKPVPASARAAMRAAVAELKRDPERRYALFEDLALEPERWLGSRIAVVGIALDPVVDASPRRFKLTTAIGIRDELQVVIDRLSLVEQAEVLRLAASYRFIALKARVKAAANGAVYLEADEVGDLGPQYGDIGLNEFR